MPQPFKGTWELEKDCLDRRPKLAVRIAEIAHRWTLVDILHGELLVEMLGPESRFTTAVYLRLRGARSAAIDAIAEEVLPEDLLKEFRKIMQKSRDVEGSRNNVVHGLWALDHSNEEILVWIDPAMHVKWHSASMARDLAGDNEELKKMAIATFNEHIGSAISYNEADFRDIENRIGDLFSIIFKFTQKVSERLRPPPPSNKANESKK